MNSPDYQYIEGMRVIARNTITEGGDNGGDPGAEYPDSEYIHAVCGDQGLVVCTDENGYPTVNFDRTGTATIVSSSEVMPLAVHNAKDVLDQLKRQPKMKELFNKMKERGITVDEKYHSTVTGRLVKEKKEVVADLMRKSLKNFVGVPPKPVVDPKTIAWDDKRPERAFLGVDYGKWENLALAMYQSPPKDTDKLADMFLRAGIHSPIPKGYQIEKVEQVHDAYVLTLLKYQPCEHINLHFEIPPQRTKEEKQMHLLVNMPAPSRGEDPCLFTLAWDGDRHAEVQKRIDLAAREFEACPNLMDMHFSFDWDFQVISLDSENNPDWHFPLVWPRSFDAEQNKEMGSDTFDLGDLVDAETFSVALVNGTSWRKWIVDEPNIASKMHIRCNLVIGRLDDHPHHPHLTFEQHTGSGDVKYESIIITPMMWAKLTDATMTLKHLWGYNDAQ